MAHQLSAIPAATHPNWRKLLSGEIDPPSTNLSFILLIFQLRLQCLHAAPGDGFMSFIDRAHEFFVKHEAHLSAEIAAIFPNC